MVETPKYKSYEVTHSSEPVETHEVDCTQFGKDWEPNTLKHNVFDMQPQGHEEDELEYGRVHQPGEKAQK